MAQFLKEVKINKNGTKLQVHVFFGQAQYGEYSFKVFDDKGKNQKFIFEGNNIDDLPDRFEIPIETKKLVDQTLSWRFAIAAPDDAKGQLYFARITFMQDNEVITDSPFEYSGALDDAKMIIGVAKVIAR